ncbi:MAG: HEPN domain-containing protein [Methanobacteriota archaeon]
MSIPDQDHINRVLLWMSYADEDLDLAIEKIKNAEELTPFAVTTRYPMLDEKVTENEAVEAVNLASMVRKTIRTALLDEGMNIEEDASQ